MFSASEWNTKVVLSSCTISTAAITIFVMRQHGAGHVCSIAAQLCLSVGSTSDCVVAVVLGNIEKLLDGSNVDACDRGCEHWKGITQNSS